MKVRRSHFRVGVGLLLCGAVLVCTCAAYDVDVRHMASAFLRAAGFGPAPREGATTETVVAAGSELSVTGRSVTVKKVPPEALARRLAWTRIHEKDGLIWFRGESLEAVAVEFNQHNKRQLVMGDVATGRLRVGGTFRLTDLDGFLGALEWTHGIKAIRSPPSGRNPGVIVLVIGVPGSPYSDESTGPEDF